LRGPWRRNRRKAAMAKDTGALVLYGRGADFGSF
jgi:hypothetical protein